LARLLGAASCWTRANSQRLTLGRFVQPSRLRGWHRARSFCSPPTSASPECARAALGGARSVPRHSEQCQPFRGFVGQTPADRGAGARRTGCTRDVRSIPSCKQRDGR
jgi:hypothetical protein